MHISKGCVIGVLSIALSSCAFEQDELTTGSAQYVQVPHPITGKYIVVFDETRPDISVDNVEDIAAQMTHRNGKVLWVYKYTMLGFWAELDQTNVEYLLRSPRVKLVSEDAPVNQTAVQNSATWGLDRIDERARPLNGVYQQAATGAGVHVYVIDSGIRSTHADFAGRMGNGTTAIADGNGTGDCNGHGTHVAGTVGGTTYGVAKGVTLHPVRVLDCANRGSNGGVIAGVDWVTGNHVKPAVANMSLSGPANNLVDDAVNRSANAGVTYVVAAGNDNTEACNYSPARAFNALTVGATDSNDVRAWFSNRGGCVEAFAPGVDITSASAFSDQGSEIMSGTSMASPHVTGVVALYLQRNPNATAAQAKNLIFESSTKNIVGDPVGSANRLLYSLAANGALGFQTEGIWTAGYSDALGWNLSASFYETFRYADVDGDGITDMCGRGSGGVFCHLSNGNTFATAVPQNTGFSNAAGMSASASHWRTLQLVDVSGDGKADLCARFSNGIQCSLSAGTSFGATTLWTSAFGDADGGTTAAVWETIQFADVTGDGKADVCGRTAAGVKCGVSNGTSFTVSQWDTSVTDTYAAAAYYKTIRFPDVNGDKKADLCFRRSDGVACALSTGTAFGALSTWTTGEAFTDAGGASGSPSYYETIQFPDLTADGKADVCIRAASGLSCAVSSGTAFGAAAQWSSDFTDAGGWTAQSYYRTLQYADIDRDGRADVCSRTSAGVRCAVSTGAAFLAAFSATASFGDTTGWGSGAQWPTLKLIDFNQDGRADMCGRSSTGMFCALTSI